MKAGPRETVTFTAISGINFPFGSRKYLMPLVKEITERENGKGVIVAGNILAGRELERELKHMQKLEREAVKLANKAKKRDEPKAVFGPAEKERVELDLVETMAHELDAFLPHIKDANYHIVIAEQVFDRPLGTKILEKLQARRKDIRLINDTEAKFPVRMAGVDDIRIIVPRKKPWYYRVITGLMQRLINSFVSRTYSPRPSLVIAGGTGTGAYLPFYQGVPSVSVPALRKIDEQESTENMAGCVTIELSVEGGRLAVRPTTYDFRSIIFNERNYLIKDNPSAVERTILEALKPSSASRQVIEFRVNASLPLKRRISEKRVAEALENLMKRKLVIFNKKSNRYEINEDILGYANITLADFLKGGRPVRHVVEACRHIGALKSLYHTQEHDLPKLMADADVFVDAGDSIQGMAHDYEYNGEVLPIATGFDKQQILSAYMFAENIMGTFRIRVARLDKKAKMNVEAFVKKCLIPFVFTEGNHPRWATRTRNAVALILFEYLLKDLLFVEVLRECREFGYDEVNTDAIRRLVEERVVRVGEDNIVEVDGVKFGVKHPHKSRSSSKSLRIQDVVDFVYGQFYAFMGRVEKKHPDVSLVYVGNFHEAAAVHVSKFGRTLLGVMIGAYLKDTQFENDKDKVVDIGPVKVEAYLAPDGQILYSSIQFVNNIHSEDQKLVLAKHITTKLVLELCTKLTAKFNLPWR